MQFQKALEMHGWFKGKGFTLIMGSATELTPVAPVAPSTPVAPAVKRVNTVNTKNLDLIKDDSSLECNKFLEEFLEVIPKMSMKHPNAIDFYDVESETKKTTKSISDSALLDKVLADLSFDPIYLQRDDSIYSVINYELFAPRKQGIFKGNRELGSGNFFIAYCAFCICDKVKYLGIIGFKNFVKNLVKSNFIRVKPDKVRNTFKLIEE